MGWLHATLGARARRPRRTGPILGALAVLAGGPAATAQSPPPEPGGFGDLMQALHLKAKVPAAPPFVRDSRPAAMPDFVPVGAGHPVRDRKVMTPAEVAAATADLDAARERQQRRAGQRPAKVPMRPAKAAPPGKITVR